MNIPETVSNRLIGELFVERGLVSQSQLLVALELQKETGQQLGQILVERFGVQRSELAQVVAQHWARLGEAEDAANMRSSESWRQLGEILVSRGFVTHEQLSQALERQRQTGERLGEALVGQGVLSKFELAGSLAEQASLVGTPDDAESEPAEIVPLARHLELARAADSVDPSTLRPAEEPGYGTFVESEEASAPSWVAFASTPRGYRLVTLNEGAAPDVGERVELPELGELVVLRRGVSPLPRDERVCVFLEPPAPVA